MADVVEARKALAKLIERYEKNKTDVAWLGNEKQTEDTLIRPLLRDVLGWDIEEDVISQAHTRGKRIDQLVRHEGVSQFIVEVKAPKHDVFDNDDAYEQAVGYGHSKDKDFAILTNFRQIVILACSIQTRVIREAEVARVDMLNATDGDIEKVLWFEKHRWLSAGKENPLFVALSKHKMRTPVDEQLLQDMISWRNLLKTNLRKNGKNSLDFDDERAFMHIEEEIQKFIDRLVFICFCEDKEIIDKKLKALLLDKCERYDGKAHWLLGEIRTLFEQYRKGPDSDLFDKSDCDDFVIDDDKLVAILQDLREPKGRLVYDFASIDADVLGRAYENFIGHLTTGTKRFSEEEDIGKRKKEGIYYTPKHVVDYIVNHAVRDCVKGKTFEDIRKIRIVDPACGSGSFLLRAFEVLIEEARASLKTEPTYAQRRDIMLNCIHGVDLDRRAVAIAKLNLALRLAERNQPLPMLRDNIVHGNSLIEDKGVAQTTAFVWQDEFLAIMGAGGFDVVIGNPPYIRIQTMEKKDVEYFNKRYKAASKGNYDIYVLFVERGIELLNKSGRLGFILPHKFFNAKYGEGLRSVVASGKHLERVVHFGDQQVFDGATTYTCLLFLAKAPQESFRFIKVANLAEWRASGKAEQGEIASDKVTASEWNFATGKEAALFERLSKMKVKMGDVVDRIYQGVITSADTVFLFKKYSKGVSSSVVRVFSESLNKEVMIEKEVLRPVVRSGDIGRYDAHPTVMLLFPYTVKEGSALLMSLDEIRDKYPLMFQYLHENKKLLESREKGRFKGAEWYCFGRSQNIGMWDRPKIMSPYMTEVLAGFYDDDNRYYFVNVTTGGYGIIPRLDKIDYLYLLALFNSRLLDFYFKRVASTFHGGYFAAGKQYLEQLPIRLIDFSDKEDKHKHDLVVKLVDKMIDSHKRLQQTKDNEEKHRLEKEIARTDIEINEIVYALYDITVAERKIIEEATKTNTKEKADSQ